MKLFRRILITLCILVTSTANAGQQPTSNGKCATNQPTVAELTLLQGTWDGFDVGDPSHQKITVTITGNSLHFYRDKDFWFDTTFTLSAGTDPKQLHTTIKESANGDAKGELVGAIFKIEDGTFTLASYSSDNDDPPKNFASYPSHYVLKKVEPQKKNAAPLSKEEEVELQQRFWLAPFEMSQEE